MLYLKKLYITIPALLLISLAALVAADAPKKDVSFVRPGIRVKIVSAAIAQALQDEWGLRPGLVSKFERALKLVDAGASQPYRLLS